MRSLSRRATAHVAGAGLVVLLVSACAETSRVTETVTSGELARDRKAVALMKIGSVDRACVRASVLLGVREGAVFRAVRKVDVVGLRAPVEPAVSEVELDAGEYHVLGYSCAAANGKQFAFTSNVDGSYRAGLASFDIGAGEILNVGYLQLQAGPARRNVLARSVPLKFTVSDWPLAEIERFRQHRPNLFAAMTVRLMKLTPDVTTPEQQRNACEELTRLQAAGKVQSLPAHCLPAAPGKSRSQT